MLDEPFYGNPTMSIQPVLTSDGKPTDPATKDWINQIADAIRKRCGEYPRLRMYAYRNNRTDYLAMDFDPTEPEICGGARSRMKCNTYGPKGPEVMNGQALQSVECR